jgi:hypothetical protein
MGHYVRAAGVNGVALAATVVSISAAVLSAACRLVHRIAVEWVRNDQPAVMSRHTGTAWCTAFDVITESTTAILSMPALRMVYQAF